MGSSHRIEEKPSQVKNFLRLVVFEPSLFLSSSSSLTRPLRVSVFSTFSVCVCVFFLFFFLLRHYSSLFFGGNIDSITMLVRKSAYKISLQ